MLCDTYIISVFMQCYFKDGKHAVIPCFYGKPFWPVQTDFANTSYKVCKVCCRAVEFFWGGVFFFLNVPWISGCQTGAGTPLGILGSILGCTQNKYVNGFSCFISVRITWKKILHPDHPQYNSIAFTPMCTIWCV